MNENLQNAHSPGSLGEWRSRLHSTGTFFLWLFGILLLVLAGVYSLLIIFVPLLHLQNDAWNRPDNPVTLGNILKLMAASAILIFLARCSSRVRFWAGTFIFAIAVLYGLSEIGVFSFLLE